MPIGRRATLGAAQHGADGTFREPPWFTDCFPWQCAAAPESAITPQMRADCPFWGPRGTLSCAAGGGFCAPWCAPAGPAPSTPGPSAPQVQQNVGAPPEQQPQTVTVPKSQPVGVTVESAAGPVVVSSDYVPGNTDQSLVPIQVRIPNIWDLLDPTSASQFEYRGLSTALPSWISLEYRRAQAAKIAGPTPDAGGAALAGVPWWVWLAIGGAAYAMSDRPAKRRVARGRK